MDFDKDMAYLETGTPAVQLSSAAGSAAISGSFHATPEGSHEDASQGVEGLGKQMQHASGGGQGALDCALALICLAQLVKIHTCHTCLLHVQHFRWHASLSSACLSIEVLAGNDIDAPCHLLLLLAS